MLLGLIVISVVLFTLLSDPIMAGVIVSVFVVTEFIAFMVIRSQMKQ